MLEIPAFAIKKGPTENSLNIIGGLKGIKTRAAKLSANKRQEITKKAAKARWSKKKKRLF